MAPSIPSAAVAEGVAIEARAIEIVQAVEMCCRHVVVRRDAVRRTGIGVIDGAVIDGAVIDRVVRRQPVVDTGVANAMRVADCMAGKPVPANRVAGESMMGHAMAGEAMETASVNSAAVKTTAVEAATAMKAAAAVKAAAATVTATAVTATAAGQGRRVRGYASCSNGDTCQKRDGVSVQHGMSPFENLIPR